VFQNVGELPRYLIPTYFEQVFKRVYAICIENAWEKMNVGKKSEFVKLLALTSLQFVGNAEGGALPAGGSYNDFIEDKKPFISYSLSAGYFQFIVFPISNSFSLPSFITIMIHVFFDVS